MMECLQGYKRVNNTFCQGKVNRIHWNGLTVVLAFRNLSCLATLCSLAQQVRSYGDPPLTPFSYAEIQGYSVQLLECLHYHVNFMELSFLLLICNEIHRRLDYIMDRLVVSMLVTFHPCMGACVCTHEHMHVYT